MSTVKPKVIVVGAGIAGLSCAWALQKQGYDVTVLEAGNSPGGRCREIDIDGLRVRAGARMLYSFYTGVMGLIDELGLHEDIVRIGHASIGCEAHPGSYPLTFGPSRSLLFGGALSKGDLFKLARLAPDLLKARLLGDPDDWLSLPAHDDQSLADYLASKGLGSFDERVVGPLFRGARNWHTDEVSAGFFLLTTAFMNGHYAFTFKQGIGHLATALASRLDVRYGMQVQRIAHLQDGMTVTGIAQSEHSSTPFTESAALVVCAVEGDRAKDLVVEPNSDVRSFLDQVRYNPLSVDYGVLDKPLPHSLTFYGSGRCDELAILETVPGSSIAGDLPRVFCQASPQRSRANLEATQDHARLDARVAEHLPGARVTRWVRQRIESMLPLPYPGYLSALRTFRDSQAAAPQRLYFAGDYLSMALVGGACASGQRTAEVIRAHWPADTHSI
jgi:oxygen-dependent protoporphyrinogen oxidase